MVGCDCVWYPAGFVGALEEAYLADLVWRKSSRVFGNTAIWIWFFECPLVSGILEVSEFIIQVSPGPFFDPFPHLHHSYPSYFRSLFWGEIVYFLGVLK